jgi:hypothetical protein
MEPTHVSPWFPILLKPAIFFEVLPEIFPSLIVLFEVLLRPASSLSPEFNWINFVLADAARCLLADYVLNSSACNRRSR